MTRHLLTSQNREFDRIVYRIYNSATSIVFTVDVLPAGVDGHVPSGRGGHQRLPPHGRGAIGVRGADLLRPGESVHVRGASVPERPEPHHQGVPRAVRHQHQALLAPRESLDC